MHITVLFQYRLVSVEDETTAVVVSTCMGVVRIVFAVVKIWVVTGIGWGVVVVSVSVVGGKDDVAVIGGVVSGKRFSKERSDHWKHACLHWYLLDTSETCLTMENCWFGWRLCLCRVLSDLPIGYMKMASGLVIIS